MHCSRFLTMALARLCAGSREACFSVALASKHCIGAATLDNGGCQ